MIDRGRWTGFAARAFGLRACLWFPTLALFRDGFAPPAAWPSLLLMLGLGLAAQAGLHAFSNRRWFRDRRSPTAFFFAAAGTTVLTSLSIHVAVLTLHFARGGAGAARPHFLAIALAQQTVILVLAFRGAADLRKRHGEDGARRERARAAARALIPAGPFQAHRLRERLGQLSRLAAAEIPRAIDALRRDLDLGADPRWYREVSWSSACALIDAWIADRQRDPSGGPRISLARLETTDGPGVRPALLARFLEALAERVTDRGSQIRLRSRASESGLCVECDVVDAPLFEPPEFPIDLVRSLTTALERGLVVHAPVAGQFPPCFRFEIKADDPRLAGTAESLSRQEPLPEIPRPNSSTVLVERGGEMIKIQYDHPFDPKPTAIEEQFAMLARLDGAGGCVPRVSGFGRGEGFSWLAYRREDGQSLERVWGAGDDRRDWFRILFDLEQIIERLRESAVAHRDLHPGNLILRPDGSLVLIDFDQAVADCDEFLDADRSGRATGHAHNDFVSFIERAGLAGRATAAIARLERAWHALDSPYRFAFAGRVFPGRLPWETIWTPARAALRDSAGRRVIDWGSTLPLFGVFAASAGAEVTIRPRDGEALERGRDLAAAAGVHVTWLDPATPAPPGRFDLGYGAALGIEDRQSGGGPWRASDGDAVTAWITGPIESGPPGERSCAPRVIGYLPSLAPLLLWRRSSG